MAAELFVQQLCMQKNSFFTLRVSGGLDPVVICSSHGLEIFWSASDQPRQTDRPGLRTQSIRKEDQRNPVMRR
jgi:hypothetical protein